MSRPVSMLLLLLALVAFAAAKGLNAEALHHKITDAGVAVIKKDMPRVNQLEAERDKLQEEVNAMTDYTVNNGYEGQWAGAQLEDLLHFCRMRGAQPTIEAIETALAGKSLACCLGNM